MLVKCNCCSKEFNKSASQISKTNQNYCSQSCAGKINNSKHPKKKLKKQCKCGTLIWKQKTNCNQCLQKIVEYRENITLGQAIYNLHHKSSAYALVRTRARSIAKSLGCKSRINCNYNKHIEIAHIKPIASFDHSTLVNDINSLTNLIPLCPNCHWEYDNGLLNIDMLKNKS